MRAFILIFAVLQGAAAHAETKETPPDPVTSAPVINVRPALKSQSHTIDKAAWLEQAKSEYAAERYIDSFNSFQTLLLHDRHNIEAAIGLGNAALSVGRFDEAYDVFSGLKSRIVPAAQRGEIDGGYALAKVESGQSRNIVRDLKAAIKSTGQDYRLWNALGRYYDQGELWGDSFDAYFTALSMGQGRAITLNNLGMSQMMQGDYAAAHESFAHAAGLKPDQDLYDNNRRLALALQSDYHMAVKGLSGERAAFILNDAGYLAMTRGEKNLARHLFKKAIHISPVHHAKAHVNLKTLNSL